VGRLTARCTGVKDDVPAPFEGRENKTWPVIRVLPQRSFDIREGVWGVPLFYDRFCNLGILLLRSDMFPICVGIRVYDRRRPLHIPLNLIRNGAHLPHVVRIRIEWRSRPTLNHNVGVPNVFVADP